MDSENRLPQLTGIVLEEQTELTLADLCRVCAVRDERILELVEEGVLAPLGEEPRRWRLNCWRKSKPCGCGSSGWAAFRPATSADLRNGGGGIEALKRDAALEPGAAVSEREADLPRAPNTTPRPGVPERGACGRRAGGFAAATRSAS